MKWVMVLNDGTTFSDLDGCSIVAVPDHIDDEDTEVFIAEADGWYVFDSFPPINSNNGQTMAELEYADRHKNYTKCGGCGEMFNLNSGFERIMAAQHNCESDGWKLGFPEKKETAE
jgi:hypothetical protein